MNRKKKTRLAYKSAFWYFLWGETIYWIDKSTDKLYFTWKNAIDGYLRPQWIELRNGGSLEQFEKDISNGEIVPLI
jgi:hypothetical protein